MTEPPRDTFWPVEVAITAFYVWTAFFAATIGIDLMFDDKSSIVIATTIAAGVAWILLLRQWISQHVTRKHPVNLTLALVAGITAIDLATALTW